MADLPEASVTIDDEAGALAGGTDVLVIVAPVATAADAADAMPRMFTSTKGLLAKHGYSQAADYAAMHFDETGKPVVFVGVPAATAGAIMNLDTSGVHGTSVVTVAAGASGVLDAVDATFAVTKGGTIGTDQIALSVSLDGGRTVKPVRLGTAASYAIPYVGIVVSFAAGTLTTGDALSFRSSAPRWDQAGIEAARKALAAQKKQARSWLVVGDAQVKQDAADVVTEINAYETASERFCFARVQCRDIRPAPKKSSIGTLTFAEVGVTGDTITRSAGSWLDDGFKVGDVITVKGSEFNDVTGPIAGLTDTVITLGTTDLVAEASVAGCKVTAPAELHADWVASLDSVFADIDDEKRVDLGAGYARKRSPITGWMLRRPVQWAASIREYQHDVQIPTWRKSDGPLSGWDLEDVDGNTVEHDERNDGGLLAARFTCFRTWANGPNGTFIALSLTRAPEGSLLSRTHNLAVANVACSVTQAETEAAVGQVLDLNADGTATEASLVLIEERVNTSLAIALLQSKSEGKRASSAKWKASRTDVLNVPGAELTGQLDLRLKGTLEKLTTRVRIQTAG